MFVKLISCRQFVLGVGEGTLIPGRGGLLVLGVWCVDGTSSLAWYLLNHLLKAVNM